jgi:hypothetical protein
VAALLGEAAKGMSELQLLLVQRLALGIFMGLDAEGSFTFYIRPSNGRIVQIESEIDIANPYGSRAAGANPRIKSQTLWRLAGFGEDIVSALP